MENLTNDLLTEILIRLPDSRQAGRCAAVCKRWFSLVSAAEFVTSFTNHRLGLDDGAFSAAIDVLWFERPFCEDRVFTTTTGKYYQMIEETHPARAGGYLSFMPWDDVVIRALCNDLLLVSRVNVGYSGKFSFCICNPITKKYWRGIPEPLKLTTQKYLLGIPELPGAITKLCNCTLTLRDNRGRLSYHVTLFFTAVDFHMMPNGRVMWTTHFSSRDGYWGLPAPIKVPSEMAMKPPFVFTTSILNQPVACDDGLLYWVEGPFPSWEWVVAFNPLAAVSVEGHRECRLIPRPDKVDDDPNSNFVRLADYRGRLRAAYITVDMVLRVSELIWSSDCRDAGASCHWSLLHNAVLGMVVEQIPVYPLALHPANRDVIFLGIYGESIIRYDMSSRTGQIVSQLSWICRTARVSVYPLFSIWPTPVPSLQYQLVCD